jgi:hypothetical protein
LSDIFQEVDEEVRREQLKKLWDRYGIFVVIAACLVVAAIGAWRGYQWWEAKKAAEAGAAFEAASTLAETGKHSEAEAAFAKIAVDGTAGYRHLARLREAAELAQGDAKAAVAVYDKIAANGSVAPCCRIWRHCGRARCSSTPPRSPRRNSDWSRLPATTARSATPRASCSCSRRGAPATARRPSAGST